MDRFMKPLIFHTKKVQIISLHFFIIIITKVKLKSIIKQNDLIWVDFFFFSKLKHYNYKTAIDSDCCFFSFALYLITK